MTNFIKTLENSVTTTNGDVAYKSTLNPILDLFSRGATSDDKPALLSAAFKDKKTRVLSAKCALYLRDVRAGQGNRDVYQDMVTELLRLHELKLLTKIIDNTPEVGSWKDLIKLINIKPSTEKEASLNKTVLAKIASCYKTDALLAKWLPRQGDVAKYIINVMGLSHGDYRRHIAKLSKTVEQKMCAQKWHEITYEHVPSLANKKYSNAFKKNDSSRYEEFLGKVVAGDTKINSSVLYPHEITAGTAHGKDALWKGMPKYMPEHMNILPVIDLSGSMTWTRCPGSKYMPMDISVGLGLYFAESNHGELKNIVMGFADQPQLTRITGDTVDAKVRSIRSGQVGYSTNIAAVYNKALQASIESGEDIDALLIISDMQFNQACGNPRLSTFKEAKEKFEKADKRFPTIIFWNVAASYGTSPVTQHESGSILVDGYSPNVLKSLFTGELQEYTPYKAMMEVLAPMYPWLED